MSVYTWAWIGWAVYFAVCEGLALSNSRAGDTLSEHVWAFIGVRTGRLKTNDPLNPAPVPRRPSGWTKLRRVAVITFMVWLTLHFTTGGQYV